MLNDVVYRIKLIVLFYKHHTHFKLNFYIPDQQRSYVVGLYVYKKFKTFFVFIHNFKRTATQF